jgi:hypothetical protein
MKVIKSTRTCERGKEHTWERPENIGMQNDGRKTGKKRWHGRSGSKWENRMNVCLEGMRYDSRD